MKIPFKAVRYIIGTAILIALVGWGVREYKASNIGSVTPGGGNSETKNGKELAADTSSKTVSLPEPEFGVFKVKVNEITDCKVLPGGQTITASPIRSCEYDWYINGKKHAHVLPGGKLTDEDRRVVGEVKIEGYTLTPGQGIDVMYFAYVKYYTPEPPKDWFALACTKLPPDSY